MHAHDALSKEVIYMIYQTVLLPTTFNIVTIQGHFTKIHLHN